jgi:hypothetical protein
MKKMKKMKKMKFTAPSFVWDTCLAISRVHVRRLNFRGRSIRKLVTKRNWYSAFFFQRT